MAKRPGVCGLELLIG